MEKKKLEVGRFVEFVYNGQRLGKVIKIKGNMLTTVLCPYTTRGRFTGKKVRIHADKLTGIVYRKKVIKWHA
jgi:hypothetical protein